MAIGETWALAESTGEIIYGLAFDPVLEMWAMGGGENPGPVVLTATAAAVAGGTPGFSSQTIAGSYRVRAITSDSSGRTPVGQFVACGDHGETWNSLNGTTWTRGTPIVELKDMVAAGFGFVNQPDDFGLVGGVNKIARGSSATSPTFGGLSNPTMVVRGITYNTDAVAPNERWVLVGSDGSGGRVITSQKTQFFTEFALTAGRLLYAVDYGEGYFNAVSFALGSDPFTHLFCRSTTGFEGSWATIEGEATVNLQAVRYLRDSIWVAGGNGGEIYRSTDNGATWDTLTSPITDGISEIDYDPGNDIIGLVTVTGEFWTSFGSPPGGAPFMMMGGM